MIRVAGLWKNKSKDGTDYLSGSWGQVKILVFKNTKKQKDTDPDYAVFLAENKPKEESREPGEDTF